MGGWICGEKGKGRTMVVCGVCGVFVCVWGLRKRGGETGGKRMREERDWGSVFHLFFGWMSFFLFEAIMLGNMFCFWIWLFHHLDYYPLQKIFFVIVFTTILLAVCTNSCSARLYMCVCVVHDNAAEAQNGFECLCALIISYCCYFNENQHFSSSEAKINSFNDIFLLLQTIS